MERLARPRRRRYNERMPHFDALIVGAGLSGIGMGCHLRRRLPGVDFAVLEGRERLGGTWDLFRYPGVRSDSDMHTLGYAFKPWTRPEAIADAGTILDYVSEAARENGIDKRIRYGARVKGADWSSKDARWTLDVEERGERVAYTCGFLLVCGGYYSYEAGYTPDFAGIETFTGKTVHPQAWPEDLDYAGKRVVVIGSGATAVTLVPAMAKTAAEVTMVQRSPTWIAPLPPEDRFADAVKRVLPQRAALSAIRWRNILYSVFVYQLSRRRPERLKKMLLDGARAYLGADFDVERHFHPSYNPWDQRLCLAPDGDLYRAIRAGRARVVTGEIESFTPSGLRMRDGEEVPADIVVTATGLELQPLGNVALSLDGKSLETSELVGYRGMMFAGVPNLITVFGYVNASWTLRADLVAERACKIIGHMRKKGLRVCAPALDDASMAREPFVDFSAGYFRRALARLPKQGAKAPWRANQNYLRDLLDLRFRRLEDGALKFGK